MLNKLLRVGTAGLVVLVVACAADTPTSPERAAQDTSYVEATDLCRKIHNAAKDAVAHPYWETAARTADSDGSTRDMAEMSWSTWLAMCRANNIADIREAHRAGERMLRELDALQRAAGPTGAWTSVDSRRECSYLHSLYRQVAQHPRFGSLETELRLNLEEGATQSTHDFLAECSEASETDIRVLRSYLSRVLNSWQRER